MVRLPVVPLLLNLGLAAGEALPYGHPDFHPSRERPIGWHADGNGAYPGATPVTAWDGTTGANIVWKTPLPDISWAQPVVVGDKVFVLCDWHRLFCLSAIDGTVLWERDGSVAELLPPPKAERYRKDLAAFETLVAKGCDWRRRLNACLKDCEAAGAKINLVVRFGGIAPRERFAAELDRIEDQADLRARFEALYQEGVANEFSAGEWCLFGVLDGRRTGVKDRKVSALREAQKFLYDECDWFHCDWGIWVTYTFATPISDGERIYVPMSNRSLWCFDLDGNRQWVTWEHQPGDYQGGFNPLYTRFSQSLAMLDGRVFWAYEGRLKAFDAKTGAKVWDIPEDAKWDQPRARPETEAETPGIVHLPRPDGGRVPLLCDGHRLIDRPPAGSSARA
jgi:hypothetical protein